MKIPFFSKRDETSGLSSEEIQEIIFRSNGKIKYCMPPEDGPHEGTWLQWPHNFGYDRKHRERLESSWISMAQALCEGENVHIIAYNEDERNRIKGLLETRCAAMGRIDFYTWPTDDIWVRDNGPIFVQDMESRKPVILDWEFNGWGKKADYKLCNCIPGLVGDALGIESIKIDTMVNEGGSFEVDGRGTFLAKKSSILNRNRNPGMTQAQAEAFFTYFLGVKNFIWLDGSKRSDITDDHIDGTARFAHGDTIVTMRRADFIKPKEYDILANARDANRERYKIVELPLTTKKIRGMGDYGIYTNYYVANNVVLIPSYNDPNDARAVNILRDLYPTKSMVPIPCSEIAKDGGMIHCVTQQQPAYTINA